MPPTLWALVALILSAFFSFLVTLFFTRRTQAQLAQNHFLAEQTALIDRLIVLEKQLALVGQAVVPISTAFQAILIKELTHMHTPILDALMTKIGPPSTLSDDEFDELATALLERTMDMGDLISDSERDAAVMLPLVMKRAQREYQALTRDPSVILQFVHVPVMEAK